MNRRTLLRGLVATFIFTACGPTAPSANAPASPATTGAGAGAPTTSSAAPGAASASEPGQPEEAPLAPIAQLVIGLPGDIVAPSPFYDFSVVDKQFMNHIAPGLTRISETGDVLPMLALSWQAIDPTNWKFKLRPNVTFHNGEPFTADTFRVVHQYMLDPNTKSTTATNFKIITNVTANDDLTLTLTTSAPAPTLLRTLSDYRLIAPADLQKRGADGTAEDPIGTGPYKFVEWIKGDHATLQANPNYWGGKPAIDTLIWRSITEDAARVAALQAGEIDLAYNVPQEMIPQIDGSGKAVTVKGVSTTVYVLGMNGLDASFPTANQQVRQGISTAIDRQGIISTIMGGIGSPLATVFHEGEYGRDDSIPVRTPDVQQAKALLAQGGFPNGFTIHLVAPQNGRWAKSEEVAQAITSQLGQIGINVDLELLEYTAFTQSVFSKKNPLALWGWSDPTFDPNTMLLQIFTCPDRGSPWTQDCDPDVDQLAWGQQSESDETQRLADLKQIQQLMYDKELTTGLLQLGIIRGVSPKMANWYRNRPDEGLWLFHPIQQ